ncbi:MAG: TonB-dependent receptor [Ferruginibacter sp.]
MRNFTTVAIAILTLLTTQSIAQSRNRINGSVKDQNDKPLGATTVSLLHVKDSSLVKAAISDAAGKFELAVSGEGSYLLSYSLVGFDIKYSPVYTMTEGQAITATTVTLSPVVSKLAGVTITSKKPMIEVKADKTVFNVEASINATGSNALELLQKSPGVQVDNNDNISMKGKTGVRVYIDGKMMQLDTKDLAAYLKSINSNDIEAIEMISNPSAKYDASGNAGIVNIRLKKNKKFGTNGSATLGLVQGETPKGNGSVNINYRDKKINIFSNVSANIGDYQNILKLYRIQKDTLYDQKSVNINANKNINIKAGADYFINSKNTIGIMATTSFGESEWTSTSNTPIYYKPTGQFVKSLQAFNTVPGNRTNANFNVNYRYTDTSGREINFDGDYGLFRGTGQSYQPNFYYGGNNNLLYSIINRNNTPTDIDIYTAKIDAEQKLGKAKLGYGVKTSFVTTKNTFDFFNDNASGVPVKILERSNTFKYTENVNAAYVNYQRELNPKWSLQAGLRAEQTNSDGILTRADGTVQEDNRVKKNYLDLFPSAALTWNVNKKNAFNLTFSRRIDRPTYQDLNPFENKLDELTYEKGNAFLRPQYTNSVELTHTFIGMINTTVGYSHVKDYATQVTDTTANATYIQQQNLATQRIMSFSMGSQLPIKKWWNGYANVCYNYQMFKGAINDKALSINIPSYGAYVQQSFTLGHDYTAELNGYFNGPSVWGATWKTRSQGGVDVGLQKAILHKQATIKISATDLFKTNPWTAISDFGGTYIKGSGAWESRTVRVSFNWRFGSNQIKNSRERKTGLESEAKRIK